MPANIRIRCKYLDCQFLDGLYCKKSDEVELDQKKGCLSYSPIKDEIPEDEALEDEEITEEEEEWMELEDEEDEEDAKEDTRFEDFEE
ncbi:MAG TPA: hypothetical protein VF338_09780 [Leptolinea sp.]